MNKSSNSAHAMTLSADGKRPFEADPVSRTRMPSTGEAPKVLLDALTDFIDARGGGEGYFQTPMSGVYILRAFQEIMPVRRMYKPSLCIVVQGAKQILFGDTRLDYTEMECLIVSIQVPGVGHMIGATPQTPFLGITIDFDVAMVRDVMQHLRQPPVPSPDLGPCVFVGQVDEPLAECILRLVRMTRMPEAVPVLYPSVMREICFWLLTGPYGREMSKLALPETQTERIARAIHVLHENFSQTLRVEQLAEAAGMSPSSFHHYFKQITSMTPLQFQKQLRLIEARRLMVSDAASVSDAAYQVGYESASQFSREYARTFGASPKRDVTNFKALLAYGTK